MLNVDRGIPRASDAVFKFPCFAHASNISRALFPEVPWHKREKENILKSVGVKVEYGERIDYGESRGAYKTIGDEEHVQIIGDYFEGLSMGKIAKKLDRSAASVQAQIHTHDQAIEKFGFCVKRKRLKGTHEAEKTEKRMPTI